MLLLLNEHGDPSFLFPNLSSNNQLAKFEKNLGGRFYFSGMTLRRVFPNSIPEIIRSRIHWENIHGKFYYPV